MESLLAGGETRIKGKRMNTGVGFSLASNAGESLE
jgi:hypothetical protein